MLPLGTEFVIADENMRSPSLSTSWKTPRTTNKDIIDLLGRLEQDNPQYTADEMIAKVVTHQKALQTLGTLSISRVVISWKPFSNFAEISEESDQISAHYGVTGTAGDSTRVGFRELQKVRPLVWFTVWWMVGRKNCRAQDKLKSPVAAVHISDPSLRMSTILKTSNLRSI
jgi:hypothetical protein